QAHQLAVDDLHHLLAGSEAAEHFLADCPLADPLHEALHDLEVDVGLEQGDAHLAEGLLNVLLGQAAGSTEAVEDAFEALRQGFEHAVNLRASVWWKR